MGGGRVHFLNKTLPESLGRVTVAAAALGHVRANKELAGGRAIVWCLGHGGGLRCGRFIGRSSKKNTAPAFLEGKVGHSGCLGREAVQRTGRKS